MLMADVISTAWNSVFLCWRLVLRLAGVDGWIPIKKMTAWGRVLNVTITSVLQIFHVFKLALCKSIIVKMEGFMRQIQLIVWCTLYVKSTKDVNLIQAEFLLRDMDICRSWSSHFSHHQSNQYLDQSRLQMETTA